MSLNLNALAAAMAEAGYASPTEAIFDSGAGINCYENYMQEVHGIGRETAHSIMVHPEMLPKGHPLLALVDGEPAKAPAAQKPATPQPAQVTQQPAPQPAQVVQQPKQPEEPTKGDTAKE